MEPRALIPIKEAARRLNVHENTIRNWMDRGIIQGYRLPSGVRRIPLSQVERLSSEMFSVPPVFDEDRKASKPPKALEDQGPNLSYPS